MLAAALAYFTVFSLAPLLIIVIAVVGLILGHSSAQDQIMGQIKNAVGDGAASMIQTMIDSTNKGGSGIIATIIAIITLITGATGVFTQLKGTLNTIWDVPDKAQSGLQGIIASIKSQFLSFIMVLGIGGLLLVSLALSAGLAAAAQYFGSNIPFSASILELANTVISFGVITIMFAALYKVLPDAKVDWRDVLIGGAFTSLLFTIGKFLIGLYLGHSGPASAFGAAGSLVVILLWVYYSSQILFFGAEFTHVYALRRAGKPVPGPQPLKPEVAAGASTANTANKGKTSSKEPQKLLPAPAKPRDLVTVTMSRIHMSGQIVLLAMAIAHQVQRLRGITNPPRRTSKN